MHTAQSGVATTFLEEGEAPIVEAMVQLVRLTARSDAPLRAARELRERVPDDATLRRLQVKVLLTFPSTSIERAAAILDCVLSLDDHQPADVDHVASCGWVHGSPCPHCDLPIQAT